MKKIEVRRYRSEVKASGFSDNLITQYEFKVVMVNGESEFVLQDWVCKEENLKRTSQVALAYASNMLRVLDDTGIHWSLSKKALVEKAQVVKTWVTDND